MSAVSLSNSSRAIWYLATLVAVRQLQESHYEKIRATTAADHEAGENTLTMFSIFWDHENGIPR